MTRNDKTQLYCSLFEKIYGEQPIADMGSLTEDELTEAIEQFQRLNNLCRPKCTHKSAFHFHDNAPKYCPDCGAYI